MYQPVIKNDPQGSYEYRVVPNNVEESWLYNRVTTDDQILGRMPLYDNPLTEGQLKSIRDWINAGAPDMFGMPASLPNRQPVPRGLAAFLDIGGFEYRVDTIRDNGTSPFAVLKNNTLDLWLDLSDDSTQLSELQNLRFEFTEEFDDYTNAQVVSATYHPNPKVVPDYYGAGNAGAFYWRVRVQTSSFTPNKVTFFRFLVNDGSHSEDYVFPLSHLPFNIKTFLSFYVVP